jgi:CubicO group peptidase (beta-lactamase class C family)
VRSPIDRFRSWDLDAAERLVDRYFDAGGQPGLAYGLVADGELVHSGGRGVRADGGDRPDLDTVFRIA